MTRFAILSKSKTFFPVVTTEDDICGYYYYQLRLNAELATLDYNTFVNHIYSHIKRGNQSPYLPYLRQSISTIFKNKPNQQ